MCLGLMEEEWDVAIILDACRYDTFKEVYRKYLPKGKLEKRVGAKDTYDWLMKNFGNGFYDVIYVSGHPAINSYGVPWYKFKAINHFFKIYNAWDIGWDEKIGTTKPEVVKETVVKALKKIQKKKVIVHFMQPHAPYRMQPLQDRSVINRGFWKGKGKVRKVKLKLIRNVVRSVCQNFGVASLFFSIRKKLNLPLNGIEEWYWRNFSREELIEMYVDNLKWALESVKELVDEVLKSTDKRVIVTADHGEALGENGFWFHLNNSPWVRIVPYLIVGE